MTAPSTTAPSTSARDRQAYAADAASTARSTDWATDIDHADPTYNPQAPEIWAELRDAGCPVAHTDRYGGMWAPITAELVREVAYDTEHFTSRAVVVSTADASTPRRPIGGAPPITSDPPFHQFARRLLLPPFAPKQIEPWEPEIRKLCRDRLDAMGDDRRPARRSSTPPCSTPSTSRSTSSPACSGFPLEDDDLFRGFVHDVLEGVNLAAERAPGRRSTRSTPTSTRRSTSTGPSRRTT